MYLSIYIFQVQSFFLLIVHFSGHVICRSVSTQDILYLPALWYHRVSQKGVTIAVNYWHDMQFDFKYVYYRFLQQLGRKRTLDSLEGEEGWSKGKLEDGQEDNENKEQNEG